MRIFSMNFFFHFLQNSGIDPRSSILGCQRQESPEVPGLLRTANQEIYSTAVIRLDDWTDQSPILGLID